MANFEYPCVIIFAIKGIEPLALKNKLESSPTKINHYIFDIGNPNQKIVDIVNEYKISTSPVIILQKSKNDIEKIELFENIQQIELQIQTWIERLELELKKQQLKMLRKASKII